MTKYILKRILLAIMALFIIAIVVFFLINLSSRSPILETDYQSKEDYQAALAASGLNKNVATRLLIYFGDIFTGKGFGRIYGSNMPDVPITTLFFSPLKYTLWITIPAFLFSSIMGISLGILAGYKKGTWVDSFINIFVVFFMGVPTFLLAAFALAFGDKLGIPISFVSPEDNGYRAMIISLILPISLLTFTSLVSYTYYTRNEVASVLSSNHVQIARSKGLDEWTVFKKHVVRNISIPIVSILVPSYVKLLAGSLVIETFFQVPGSSSVIINSVANAEYNIIMFNTLFFAFLGLTANIIVDVLYILIDPRIRYESATEFAFLKRMKYRKWRNYNYDKYNKMNFDEKVQKSITKNMVIDKHKKELENSNSKKKKGILVSIDEKTFSKSPNSKKGGK